MTKVEGAEIHRFIMIVICYIKCNTQKTLQENILAAQVNIYNAFFEQNIFQLNNFLC